MAVLPFDYEEFREPTTEEWNLISGVFEATRTFKGPWADRFNFITQYLMKPIAFASGATYSVPDAYPDFPVAHIDNVSISGEGKPAQNPITGQAQWDRAVITANYKPHNFNFGDFPQDDKAAYVNAVFIEESLDTEGEITQIEGHDVKLDDIRAGDKGLFSLQQTFGTLVLVQQYIINPFWIIMDQALGKCNDRVFITPSGHPFNSETLIYDGPLSQTKVNVNSGAGENFPLPVWELTHKFTFNRQGHNKRLKDGKFVDWRDPEGKRYIKTFDLSAIFFGFTGGFDLTTLILIDALLAGLIAYLDQDGTSITDLQVKQDIDAINAHLRSLGFRV